jgi:GNAT superfamily N-acetyltransferase
VNGVLVPRAALTPDVRRAMVALLARQFEGVRRPPFERDLNEKNWVILLHDADGRLRGFTTIDCYDVRHRGERLTIIYSGDTIVEPGAQAVGSALSRCWIGAVNRLRERAGSDRLFWFLIVSGYRTYRFLPLYWRRFYPCWDTPTPRETKELMDALATNRFGGRYDPETGVVRLTRPQVLRGELRGIPPGRLADPHIRFFAEHNPGHGRGDELVCVTELARDNLTTAGERMWTAGETALLVEAAP